MNCVTEPLTVETNADILYAYATIHMGSANPVDYVNGQPCWVPEQTVPAAAATRGEDVASGLHSEAPGGFVPGQKWDDLPEDLPQFLHVIELGTGDGIAFVPVVRFGLADDRRRLWRSKAHVCAWVSDGTIDRFGPFVRPDTPYDFKLLIDLAQRRLTAWVAGRGDDDWFLLAEDVALPDGVVCIDRVRTAAFPNAPAVEGPRVTAAPRPEGEALRPHPRAKADRIVDPDNGFKCQSMRSTWRKPGKHVTVFREPSVHAGFPDVAQAERGHLVCVWLNHSHTGDAGGTSIAHSHDNGRTWGPPGSDPEGYRIQTLSDGTVLLFSTHGMVLCSHDGARTWVEAGPKLRDEDPDRGGPQRALHWHCRVVELSDGSWLAEPSIQFVPAEEIVFLRSTDRGGTWRFVSNPKTYPPYCLSESSSLETGPGRLVTYARESRDDGMPAARGESEDGDKTWRFQDMPFAMTGRPCAGFLRDGRVMITFRSGIGRAALWAWIGDVNDATGPQPMGSHFNDSRSVGLTNDALYIDNDGRCGQFTKYNLRPADTEDSTIDLTFEVMVQANAGRAATVSIPFAGLLRLFPDRVEMAHNPSLRADIEPGRFHTYRVISRLGRMELFIDGQPVWDTGQGDGPLQDFGWARTSRYGLSFGNEELTRMTSSATAAMPELPTNTLPEVYDACIGPEVTGCSLWRRFEAVNDDPDPKIGRRVMAWDAASGDFPDQYQLDHIIEVEATTNGHDNGYSGWVQLDDGRIFVVNYTDDTAAAGKANPSMLGVPWIRGTWLDAEDLPPGQAEMLRSRL